MSDYISCKITAHVSDHVGFLIMIWYYILELTVMSDYLSCNITDHDLVLHVRAHCDVRLLIM